MKPKIIIYTDGACSGNPGPGGWGALLISDNHEKKIYGSERDTTNSIISQDYIHTALLWQKEAIK